MTRHFVPLTPWRNTANGASAIFRIGSAEIERGKVFVQLKNGPFDLVFAPDGIERFEEAWNRRVEVEGFPVCIWTTSSPVGGHQAAKGSRSRSLVYGHSANTGCNTAIHPLEKQR
jgi:hypothetical protein